MRWFSAPLSAISKFHRRTSSSPWWPRRPLATLGRKLRQGRKAATVSTDAGAEVSRRGHRHSWAPPMNPKVCFANFGPRLLLPEPPALRATPLTQGG